MGRLFAPLDVGYAEDHKIIDAGPMAELLYVRSLAFVKRAGSDGWIAANQLALIAARIPTPARQADRLVDVGLWEVNGTGWYISAWLRHNLAEADVKKAKSKAGSLGNHNRWHVGPSGVPKTECDHCLEQGLIR
jgi:hypothetical protein